MNAQELSALIKQAQTGDTEGYAQLYRAVYRPVYKIARMAMKSEDAAVEAVRLTVLDSFAALPAARLTSSPQFIEWLVKILCTKIRHINKTGGELCTKTDSGSEIRNALNDLPDIERLVLSVSTVCGCSAEKTAKPVRLYRRNGRGLPYQCRGNIESNNCFRDRISDGGRK